MIPPILSLSTDIRPVSSVYLNGQSADDTNWVQANSLSLQSFRLLPSFRSNSEFDQRWIQLI